MRDAMMRVRKRYCEGCGSLDFNIVKLAPGRSYYDCTCARWERREATPERFARRSVPSACPKFETIHAMYRLREL